MAVFILGASMGIGLELAKLYAEREMTVWGIGRSESAPYSSPHFHYRQCDATKFTVDSMPEIKAAVFDTVYMNAAVFGPTPKVVTELVDEKLNEVFNINVTAQYRAFKELLPQIPRSGEGKIAFMVSKGGLQSNIRGHGAIGYRVTKAAQMALGLSLVHFCTENGIGVCLVNPGWVSTRIGGKAAPISAADSAAGIKNVVDGMTRNDWGKCFNHDGTPLKF